MGKSLREIARELEVDLRTVNTYRSRIMKKLNLTSNKEMTDFMVKNQLLEDNNNNT